MTAGRSTLDEARRALYAGPRATFVERRKELAGGARSVGDRDSAKLIGEMRKPTAAAHLVNLLANANASSLQALLDLGASIRAAMADGNDREIRSLLQRRAAALAKTVAQAQEIAHANGESVSGATGDQIVQILRAAMASDEAAAAVRAGILIDAIDEPDFGAFPVEHAPRAPVPRISGNRDARSRAEAAVSNPVGEEAPDRAAARQRIKSAAADVTLAERAVAAAAKRRDGLENDRERLVSQLARIEDELAIAQGEVDDAEAKLGLANVSLLAASTSSSASKA